ncbi:hypothetical protein [Nocardia alba]|uniref:Uncharacterized protein n=1 Tax=Nocardia alba TaxID=225051 RepID=A0A4R1FAX5_9NOCA|nr:hypothetical protein [Nocardia alba]TCJ89944.1 hypothetical protein DFR71_6234 [Nocardia alba]
MAADTAGATDIRVRAPRFRSACGVSFVDRSALPGGPSCQVLRGSVIDALHTQRNSDNLTSIGV